MNEEGKSCDKIPEDEVEQVAGGQEYNTGLYSPTILKNKERRDGGPFPRDAKAVAPKGYYE